VWDVLTFWPRTYHPFAVRPYAERAVPELQLYLRQAVPSDEPLTVVAHSQGAALAYAALAPFAAPQRATGQDGRPGSRPEHPLTGVRLVTLGSPLRVLYARWFPAHFAAVEFDGLHDALQQHGRGWVNVHRHTDQWGGSTFAGDAAVDDHALADPPARGRPLAGHGGYWGDPLVEALFATTERDRVGASGGEQ
jgi:hypothetical protein